MHGVCYSWDDEGTHAVDIRRLTLLSLAVGLLGSFAACDAPTKANPKGKMVDNNLIQTPDETLKITYDSTMSQEDQRKILVKVNNEEITLGEYERRLNSLAPFARARYNTPARKKDFLDNMIQFEVLAQHASKKGYDKHPEVLLELKQAMVRKMLADELANDKLGQIPPEEVKAYYKEHESDYIRPAKVRASQIVRPSREELEKVHAELKAAFKKDPTHKRRVFALKAREVSTDAPTAKLGGDMRFFAHPKDGGTVDGKLADAAFGLKKVNQISEPIQTDKGWHMVMLTARKQRYERSFEEVERSIINRLTRERRSIREQKFVDEAKTKAKVVIHEDLLAKIPDVKLPEGQEQRTHNHDDHAGKPHKEKTINGKLPPKKPAKDAPSQNKPQDSKKPP